MVLVVMAVVGWLWYQDHSSAPNGNVEESTIDQQEVDQGPVVYSPGNNSQQARDQLQTQQEMSADLNPVAGAQAMNDMRTCLDIDLRPFSESDLTVEAFLERLQEPLGAVVLKSEDWSHIQVKMADGTRRRIRVENDTNQDGDLVRRLSYFSINNLGVEEELPVSEAQRENPTESLIASLSSDGEVELKEMALDVYFATGEEVKITERNGQIADVEFTLNGKTFKCLQLQKSANPCTCN